jgi:hypothetical protein
MNRWRTIILGTLAAAAMAGCGTSQPAAAVIYLTTSQEVPFTGDVVTLTAQASEPYAKACPAASRVEVTLPGNRGFSVVPVAMAPCGGAVWISPLFPGRQ